MIRRFQGELIAEAKETLFCRLDSGGHLIVTIHLKPEVEALIQQDVQRGPYESAEEFVERAVQMLHEQEEWLAENHAEIAAKIEEGYASAQRGELFDAEDVRAIMEAKKRAWMAEHRRG